MRRSTAGWHPSPNDSQCSRQRSGSRARTGRHNVRKCRDEELVVGTVDTSVKGAAEFYTNDLVRGGGSCLDGFEVIAGPHRHAARVGAGCATFSGARTAAPSQPAGLFAP